MSESSMLSEPTETEVLLRCPEVDDGRRIWELVKSSKPLDLNSVYSYLLLCRYFAETCVVAEREGQIVGFVSSFIPPHSQRCLFVWQVAVSSTCRGEGLAGRMLGHLLARPVCGGVAYIETSVSPSNEASQRLFRSFAEKLDAECVETMLFSSDQFGEEEHEDEILFRIGPFEIGKTILGGKKIR